MNTKLISSLIKNRWRKYMIVFCLFLGIGMMFSVRQLFPVFLDLIAYKMRQEDDLLMKPEAISVKAVEVETPEYRHYFPLVSQKEETPLQLLKEESQNQDQVEIIVEDNFIPVDFEDGAAPITIIVDPQKSQNKDEDLVKIKFIPGDHCVFGEGYACVSEFTTPAGNKIIFVSVHSGIGGEADALRDLFEGTGINQGLFNEDEVLHNLKNLKGSEIRIKQGEENIMGLALEAVARISPDLFTAYTKLPVEEALDFAIQNLHLDPALLNQDLMIIETCGWRLSDEIWVDGLEDTSSSVYLGFIKLYDEGNKIN